MSFDFNEKKVAGTATIIFRPLSKSKTFSLDAIRLRIDEINLIQKNITQPLSFDQQNQALDTTLDQYYSTEEKPP